MQKKKLIRFSAAVFLAAVCVFGTACSRGAGNPADGQETGSARLSEETAAAETETEEETEAPVKTGPVEADDVGYVLTPGLALDLDAHLTTDSEITRRESSDESVAAFAEDGSLIGCGRGQCTVTLASGDNELMLFINVADQIVPGASYIGGVMICNKTYSIPADYNPGADEEAYAALETMMLAATDDGISLWLISGFRTYDYQAKIYSNYCARDGQAEADRYSARPGHSEHQSGFAFDLNLADETFGDTAEGHWLAEHCSEYGFILRYPHDKEAVTGYMYEPWHVRYLGKPMAQAVTESGLCLEEYLGIDSVYAD